MKIRYNGDKAFSMVVGEHRDGNGLLHDGETFDVPSDVAKELLASSAAFSKAGKDEVAE